MTAAHCDVYTSRRRYVTAGLHTFGSGNPTSHLIVQFLRHPNYDPSLSDYDVALVRVQTPFVFTDDVGAICAPEADNLYVDEPIVISGWGDTTQGKTSHSNSLIYSR